MDALEAKVAELATKLEEANSNAMDSLQIKANCGKDGSLQ